MKTCHRPAIETRLLKAKYQGKLHLGGLGCPVPGHKNEFVP